MGLKQQLADIKNLIVQAAKLTDVDRQKREIEQLSARVARLERQVDLIQTRQKDAGMRPAIREIFRLQRKFVQTVLLADLTEHEARLLVADSGNSELETTEELRQALDLITQNLKVKQAELNIFYCFFGFDDGIPKTYKEVANIFEIPEKDVQRTVVRLIHKIRHPNNSWRLKKLVSYGSGKRR